MRTLFLASFWWIVSSALALLALVVGYSLGRYNRRRELYVEAKAILAQRCGWCACSECTRELAGMIGRAREAQEVENAS